MALGINTELAQANRQTVDVKAQVAEQQQIAVEKYIYKPEKRLFGK